MSYALSKKTEHGFHSLLILSTLVSIIATVGIVGILGTETFDFFRHVSVFEFLSGTRWEPLLEPQSFGVLPLIWGTLMIMVGAGLVAIPMGLLTAIYLSEYASDRVAAIFKPVLEILAGIPTVVYGYFALTFVTPLLQNIFPQLEIFNALSGAIVVGILITPMVGSLCNDAFVALPKDLREGGYAMGATTFEVIKGVILPATAPRVFAAFILALSRAIGETMAVTLAAGATPNISFLPFDSIQTMTAYIVQVTLGDAESGGVESLTSYAVGALLFIMTLGMNMTARKILFLKKVDL